MIAPRAGVSATSYSKISTFAAISGSWSSDYPVTNLRDLVRSAQPARVTPASGAAAFSVVMPSSQTVQLAALVHHTLPAGATVRLRLYSDAAMTGLVLDSGLYGAWPQGSAPSAGYMATRPFLTDAPAMCRAARVDLAGLTGATDIGAFELAKWWEWPGVSPGANIGFSPTQSRIDYIGGASEGRRRVPAADLRRGDLAAGAAGRCDAGHRLPEDQGSGHAVRFRGGLQRPGLMAPHVLPGEEH
jgi:hypothetical protein